MFELANSVATETFPEEADVDVSGLFLIQVGLRNVDRARADIEIEQERVDVHRGERRADGRTLVPEFLHPRADEHAQSPGAHPGPQYYVSAPKLFESPVRWASRAT